MSNRIGWCDTTWNPVTGCTPISEACDHCYARSMANRLKGRFGYPADDPFRVTLHPDKLDEPRRWRKPRRVFVVSMGDLFHEDVDYWWLDDIIDVMRGAPQHTYLLLTKRPGNAYRWLDSTSNSQMDFIHSKCWLGVTVENQQRADERIPILLKIPAAKRFVSYEPVLGPVDFRPYKLLKRRFGGFVDGIDWVILGQETGPGARPAKIEWFLKVIEDCKQAGVPVWVKKAPPGVPVVREMPR